MRPTDQVVEVFAEMAGTVTAVLVQGGQQVRQGQSLLFVESMKLEHPATAPQDAIIADIAVSVGDVIGAAQLLLTMLPADATAAKTEEQQGKSAPRADIAEVAERHRLLTDEARPDAVARRHARGRRTAREMIARLIDEGSWLEWGGLAVAAQRAIRGDEELRQRTPADGFIGGVGKVSGASCYVASYDYMVQAGTQGAVGHRKKDRLFDVVDRRPAPVVLFAEGGGGRPSDTDVPVASALDADAFRLWARLSGRVPRIGIAAGHCFAGNAGLLGMCDVVIATRGSNIGMGGPAMIEGGGLGVVAATDIGPAEMHFAAGSVDLLAADDDQAVDLAAQLVGLFSTSAIEWQAADQAVMRGAVPEERKQAYDVHRVIDTLCDAGSVVELRAGFGRSIVTSLGRIEGRTVGILASDCRYLAGAIDGPASDKAADFLELCQRQQLPVISLIDTPGIMVGPAVEETGLVKRSARVFTVGASLTVPLVSIVLRRAFGLGAQALMGGSLKAPLYVAAWPTGELGPMGLEGAVRLALRAQLSELPDDDAERLVADSLQLLEERAKAVSVASFGEIDDVIDPADTRRIIAQLLAT